MSPPRPYDLSIDGFDPSGGAGLLADCKTLEANGVYGLGVCTALTIQNDVTFERASWVAPADIRDQIRLLLARFPIDFVKIGLYESLPQLLELTRWLKNQNPYLQLVWDPVLKATAGFEFHQQPDPELLRALCMEMALLTPNRPEMLRLWPAPTAEGAAEVVSAWCPVLLKGGHTTGSEATDLLFCSGPVQAFSAPRLPHGEKHGSGCVLSAAILGQLARGAALIDACRVGKAYTATVLASNSSLLGYHFTTSFPHEN